MELESVYLTRIVQQPCCPQRCSRYTRGKRVLPAGRRLDTAKGCTAGCGSSSQASPGARFVNCRKSEGNTGKDGTQPQSVGREDTSLAKLLQKLNPPGPQGRDFPSPPAGGWTWPGELQPLTSCVVRRRTKMKRNKNTLLVSGVWFFFCFACCAYGLHMHHLDSPAGCQPWRPSSVQPAFHPKPRKPAMHDANPEKVSLNHEWQNNDFPLCKKHLTWLP